MRLGVGYPTLFCTVECLKCKQTISGWIEFSKRLQVQDSSGFMVFEDGPMCDNCLTKETGIHPNTIVDLA